MDEIQNMNQKIDELSEKLDKVLELLSKKEKKEKVKKAKPRVTTTNKSYGNKKTYLTEYKNAILIHGNTFDFKDDIKSLGGFWNGLNKGWIMSLSSKELIMEQISDIVVSDTKLSKSIKDEDGEPFQPRSPKVKINNCAI